MKSFQMPILSISLLGLCLSPWLNAPAAHADFTFAEPVNLGPTINGAASYGPCVSPDGLELYFSRDDGDIYVARRTTPEGEWGTPAKLGSPVNSPSSESGPCLSADGLSLYFESNRPGTLGNLDLWVATRATVSDDWGAPVNLGEPVNSAREDAGPSLSADGLELYFSSSNRPGGYGSRDLWVTTRATVNDKWGTPVNLGPGIHTSHSEATPSISPDGLVLFFDSSTGTVDSWDIYMTRRATRKDAWGPRINLGPPVNTTTWECAEKVSFDGSMLYWHSPRPGGFSGCDMWQAPIIPIVDFTGDGRIDGKDLGLLADNWGQNKPLYDIGPFPWGDGVVDEKDLGVLMESLVTPKPKALDVPCDVTLSWISPSFAQTCDIYCGTSFEAVNAADRANPRNVLVSQGQTATTYDPAEPLKLSQTYYWRVDFVIAGPTSTIVKGPVLTFTTGALTYPIRNITATASSAAPGSGPEKTVDGSGLDKSDGHSTDPKDMWWSQGVAPHWIQYEFDRIYTLHELWVWNMNQIIELFIGLGAKMVKIEYSTNGTTWTALADVPEFAKAPGKGGYTADTIVSFTGVPAKFVKLTVEKNWSTSAPQTGLSEVRFFAIQSIAVPKP